MFFPHWLCQQETTLKWYEVSFVYFPQNKVDVSLLCFHLLTNEKRHSVSCVHDQGPDEAHGGCIHHLHRPANEASSNPGRFGRDTDQSVADQVMAYVTLCQTNETVCVCRCLCECEYVVQAGAYISHNAEVGQLIISALWKKTFGWM